MIDVDITLTMLDLIHTTVTTAYTTACEAEQYSILKHDCPALSDVDFFVACIVRACSKVDSGRDFLQHYRQIYGIDICHSSWFTACSNPRRSTMLEAVSSFFQLEIKKHMGSLGANDKSLI